MEGRPADALDLFRQALQIRPDDSNARFNLAASLAEQGRLQEAAENFRQILAAGPDDREAREQLMAALIAIGGAAVSEGRLPAAAESYRELVGLDPRNADLRNNFGTILARTGDITGAIAQFEAALEDRPWAPGRAAEPRTAPMIYSEMPFGGTMRRIILAFCLAAACAYGETQRELAEWVIRWEGRVYLEGARQPIVDIRQIPAGDIKIVGIDLTGAVMLPAELEKLTGLTTLRELYLPGPIWNPGGGNEDANGVFKALATLTSLEKLYFGWHFSAQINIRDTGFKHLLGSHEFEGHPLLAVPAHQHRPLTAHQAAQSRPELHSVHRRGPAGACGNEGPAAPVASRHHGHRRRPEASGRIVAARGARPFRHADDRHGH